MRSITRLFGAFGTLADSVLALAGVIDVATGKLRQQLALETDPVPILGHQPGGDTEVDSSTTAAKGRKARAG